MWNLRALSRVHLPTHLEWFCTMSRRWTARILKLPRRLSMYPRQPRSVLYALSSWQSQPNDRENKPSIDSDLDIRYTFTLSESSSPLTEGFCILRPQFSIDSLSWLRFNARRPARVAAQRSLRHSRHWRGSRPRASVLRSFGQRASLVDRALRRMPRTRRPRRWSASHHAPTRYEHPSFSVGPHR